MPNRFETIREVTDRIARITKKGVYMTTADIAERQRLNEAVFGYVEVPQFSGQLPAEFSWEAYAAVSGDAFEAKCRAFNKWCTENGVFYYARPREMFSQWEGVSLAHANGCTSVILEDLS